MLCAVLGSDLYEVLRGAGGFGGGIGVEACDAGRRPRWPRACC